MGERRCREDTEARAALLEHGRTTRPVMWAVWCAEDHYIHGGVIHPSSQMKTHRLIEVVSARPCACNAFRFTHQSKKMPSPTLITCLYRPHGGSVYEADRRVSLPIEGLHSLIGPGLKDLIDVLSSTCPRGITPVRSKANSLHIGCVKVRQVAYAPQVTARCHHD